MRQKCEECGIHNACNEDGVCRDCEQELLDSEYDEEECEYGHPQCNGDCDEVE